MQLIAMLTMLIDHIGLVFFEDQIFWRVVGRIAFPIYAYFIVLGYRRTGNVKRYMGRLLAIALISQVPYMVALDEWGVNAVGTLLVCTVILYLIEKKSMLVSIPAAIVAVVLMESLNFDYGLYGLLLVLIYQYTQGHFTVFSHFALNLLFLFYKDWVIEAYSIVSTVGIVYAPAAYRLFERRQVPKWLWRSFYPAHLSLIAILEFFLVTYK